jgi:DNA-directed RNA polymerase subunit RPC12/RpoP
MKCLGVEKENRMTTHQDYSIYQCVFCGKIFKSYRKLNNTHIASSNIYDDAVCKDCRKETEK